MRKIENYGDGELLDTIFVFEDELERENFFRIAESQILEAQRKSLADLHRAYMSNIVRVNRGRRSAGKKKTEEVHKENNRAYMDQVRKVHVLYAGSLAKLRTDRENSLLESQISDPIP